MKHTIATTQFLRRTFAPTHLAALSGIVLLVIGLCACSPTSTFTGQPQAQPSQTPTPSPQPSLLTALPLLQKSIQALAQVQSVHVNLSSHGSIQANGFQLPGGTQSSNYTLTTSQDIAVKKQAGSGKLTFSLASAGASNVATISASEVIVGQKLYIRLGDSATWQVLDLAALPAQASKALVGFPSSQTLLQLASQHVTVTDQGQATVGNTRLHRLTITLDQQSADALAAALPQSMLKQALSGFHLLSPVNVTLYLNEATALPQQVVVTGKGQLNIGAATTSNQVTTQQNGGQGRTATVTMTTTITFSKYNKTVQIQAPNISAHQQG